MPFLCLSPKISFLLAGWYLPERRVLVTKFRGVALNSLFCAYVLRPIDLVSLPDFATLLIGSTGIVFISLLLPDVLSVVSLDISILFLVRDAGDDLVAVKHVEPGVTLNLSTEIVYQPRRLLITKNYALPSSRFCCHYCYGQHLFRLFQEFTLCLALKQISVSHVCINWTTVLKIGLWMVKNSSLERWGNLHG